MVAKASDGQRYPCPAWVGCAWNWGGSRAAAPKGRWPMLSHIWGIFLFSSLSSSVRPAPPLRGPNSSPETQIPVPWPKSYAKGPNPSLKAQILAWRPKSQPRDPNLILEAGIWTLWLRFRPNGWDLSLEDLGLKARILALRLGFGPFG